MAQKIENSEDTLADVNVIPLADLSLVLLIILMVLSPMITQALFQVTPANAQRAESQDSRAVERCTTGRMHMFSTSACLRELFRSGLPGKRHNTKQPAGVGR